MANGPSFSVQGGAPGHTAAGRSDELQGDHESGVPRGGGTGERPSDEPHTSRSDATASKSSDKRAGDQNKSRESRPKIKKNTRAHIKIASLNMRGFGSISSNDKWNHIHRMMKEERIGVLALQETHLTEERVNSLHAQYGRRLKIVYTSDEEEPSQRTGVAIVLNKDVTNVNDLRYTKIAAGRALLLKLHWHRDLCISILAVYAPNAPSENSAFWKDISNFWANSREARPDIMLGDMNVVEDSIDRSPPHRDDDKAVEALSDLKSSLGLIDGWRTTFPNTCMFTYTQGQMGSVSRIDRIYVKRNLRNSATDWEIQETGIRTDHKMVSVNIVDRKAPYIGKGRWAIPPFLLQDKVFQEAVNELGNKLENKLDDITMNLEEEPRSEQVNAQSLFTTFKSMVLLRAQERAKALGPKYKKQIAKLRKDVNSLSQLPDGETALPAESLDRINILNEKIAETERKRQQRAKLVTAARYRLEGETLSKYWTNITKEKKPRDVFFELREHKSNPPRYLKRSDQMANSARDFYEDLQKTPHDGEPEERAHATVEVLSNLDDFSACPQTTYAKLLNPLSADEVKNALKSMEGGKAAGLDGLTYEFWKMLEESYIKHSKTAPRQNAPAQFNILRVLTMVFNDIERHGVTDGSPFADGWICPLYKKNDPREISNYRPITLLNCDYKVFTKALAMKLAEGAPQMIHPNQAGFVPGRSIFDQVKLAQLMVDYAEAVEEDGVIVALDQEKAYDRISHDYLWKTLEKMSLPIQFRKTVRSLYEHARSTVIINGERSEFFTVTRGVRQGDPLSCILFILAIEPLAASLRNSALTGYKLVGQRDRLITTLFADDTTVYLSASDDFYTLKSILDRWCLAAGAKFNVDKTVIIPIGSPTFRERVVSDRAWSTSPNSSSVPREVKILKDGEPTRILGAWIGNEISEASSWVKILEKVDRALSRWSQCSPSLPAKALIIQMVVGGMTQYLSMAQGMPTQIEKVLVKKIRGFIWGDRSPPVNMGTLYRKPHEGGINLLDLKARNEAIDLMWAKSYLRPLRTRPAWAFVADVLIGNQITRASGKVEANASINVFLQSWKVNLSGNSLLPKTLLSMLKTAHRYNVRLDAAKLSTRAKKQLPIWYHVGGTDKLKSLNNSKCGKCLRSIHKVRTVGDLLKITRRKRLQMLDPPHILQNHCRCRFCSIDSIDGCQTPHSCVMCAQKLLDRLYDIWNVNCQPPRDHLTLTHHRKHRNIRAFEAENDEEIVVTFDPSVTSDDAYADGVRVFGSTHCRSLGPAYRERSGVSIPQDSVTIYTDGSCDRNGYVEAACGSGLWYGPEDHRNRAFKIPGDKQSNQVGELVAILKATQLTANFAPLEIVTDSMYAIKGLTKHLKQWEDRGWIGIENREWLRPTAFRLRLRTAPTTFRWVKGHSNDPGNDGADSKAKEGARKPQADYIDTSIDPRFDIQGARLASLTQAIAYAGIREQNQAPDRRTTMNNIEIVQATISETEKVTPTAATIWKAIRSRDYRKNVSDFIWKTTHGAYRVGNFWADIPGYQDRAICPMCAEEESMDHILTKCKAPGQMQVWQLVRELLGLKAARWPDITLGSIVGSGAFSFKTEENRRNAGHARLFRIVTSESAFLIWKLRNERRIKHSDDGEFHHSLLKIRRLWVQMINARLALDREMANKKRYGRKALTPNSVLWTWRGTLKDEGDLPENWLLSPEVLVGIGVLRGVP